MLDQICICEECGDEFIAMTNIAKMCSAKCRMRRWRRTEKGRANVLKFNKSVKRSDIDRVCEVCGDGFVTARKDQVVCRKVKCKRRGMYLAQKRHRVKCPDRDRARQIINKRIQRGVSMVKKSCSVCGEDAESHHPDYDKPLDVIWLCRKHHNEVHAGKRFLA